MWVQNSMTSSITVQVSSLFSGYMGGGGEEQTSFPLPIEDSSVFLLDWVWFCFIGILFCSEVGFSGEGGGRCTDASVSH